MVRIGLVGIGFMGRIHYLAGQRLQGAKVVAVCSRDPAKLAGDWRNTRGNFGPEPGMVDLSGVKKYAAFTDLLADPEIDLVDICTVTDQHAPLAVQALKAGKHVLVEKAIALTPADADGMLAAARQAGKLLMVAHVLPFFPEFKFAAEAIRGGQYGKPLGAHFKRVISKPDWSADIGDAAKTGGPAVDLHIHDTHFIGLVCGVPRQVFATGVVEGGAVTYLTTSYLYGPGGPAVTCSSGAVYMGGRPVALATGLGQVVFTSVVGFLICLGLGMAVVPAVYVAVALTFSSTIIIVKLLSDKREIDALHGRIAVGFLIVQDIVVVVVMIALSAFGAAGEAVNPVAAGLLIAGKGVGFLAVVGLLMRYALPPLTRWLARSQELLILFAVAWAMLLASVGGVIGFSKEVGAFLAGVSLASTPFRESIGGRLVSLRDFLLLFFFIELGAGLDLSLLGEQVLGAAVLSVFVLVGNPLIVMAIMGYMGYRKRTGFLAGLTVAQISEFSLVLGALGVALGHIEPVTMGLITLVGLVTIGLSTYLILYSHPVYERIAPWLSVFERKMPYRERHAEPPPAGVDFILFGLGRFGSNIARSLRRHGATVLGIDFDPEVIAAWHAHGHPAQYGDAEDPELAASLPLAQARCVVCTAPQRETNLSVLQAVREYGFKGKVVLTAHHTRDAQALREAGADLVLLPFVEAAREAAADLLAATKDQPHRDDAPAGGPGAKASSAATPTGGTA
jgi:predicted dehydrogenase/Kef-type K+ transport system membrane component KefB